MSNRSTDSAARRRRTADILFGPPGLFIGLTLAILILGGFIGQSTAGAASPPPAPAAAASR